jgi:hypothetical protein
MHQLIRLPAPLGDDDLFRPLRGEQRAPHRTCNRWRARHHATDGEERPDDATSVTGQFAAWVRRDGTGMGFDSSTGFLFPNGREGAPDVA